VDAMARIGYLYLRKGQWEGQEIIPQGFVEEVGQPVSSVQGLPLHEADLWPGAQNHYGLLWWNNADGMLAHVPRDAFWAWGMFESIILVIPSLDIVVSRAGTEGWQNGFAADYGVLEPFFTPIAESVMQSTSSGDDGGRHDEVDRSSDNSTGLMDIGNPTHEVQ
jgi:CubicO group peptidase (beta-lactamase class C family)